MSEYIAKIQWRRSATEMFIDNKYSRGHHWIFDGGAVVNASAAPQIVPSPFSVSEYVDPEEAFVASLASCHMLFFLSLAVKRKLIVDQYTDNAIGYMNKDEYGKLFISKVILRPKVDFSTETEVNIETIEQLHHDSHNLCFIAHSVKSEVIVESVL